MDKNANGSKKSFLIWEEIKSQGQVWNSVISRFSKIENDLLKIFKDHGTSYFIGSGSSYNSSLIAQLTYDSLFEKRSISAPSSEFLISPNIFVKNNSAQDIFILTCRSGETTDTLLAFDYIKKLKGYILSLTSYANSKLGKNSNYSIILKETKEKSMTSTKSTSSATMVLLGLIFLTSGKKILIEKMAYASDYLFKNFDMYSNIISSIINTYEFDKFTYLGSGPLYGLAREAALKSKEMSITNTEFFHSLEYRHGHNTIADKKSLIVLFLSDSGFDYEINFAAELKKIGAKVLIICDSPKVEKFKYSYDFIINLNLNMEILLRPIFYQIFPQLIGYHQAVKKGIDPSNPRYLTKCITF